MADSEEILARVVASPGRRLLGVGALWTLAFLLVYLALAKPPALAWQLFLLAMGGAAAWLGFQMQAATRLCLELTSSELRDSSGACLARIDEIASIDRGMFAFKPSNGFLIRLHAPGARVWRPGLWWRLGRRIGVGGMTSARHTRPMADIISAVIAERDTRA